VKPTAKQRIWMYEAMFRSRRLDEQVFEAYWDGEKPVFHMGKGPLPGEMRQSFGQEPTAVGVCAHLGADGAIIQQGKLITELMVEKAQLELNAPASARLKILAPPDTIVRKGQVIGTIEPV
jgi:hypothetical protein